MRSNGNARLRARGSGRPKFSKCKGGCGQMVPAGSLVHGECPDCAGLAPLPLRGEGGRFISLTSDTDGNDTKAAAYMAKYAAKVAEGAEGGEGK